MYKLSILLTDYDGEEVDGCSVNVDRLPDRDQYRKAVLSLGSRLEDSIYGHPPPARSRRPPHLLRRLRTLLRTRLNADPH